MSITSIDGDVSVNQRKGKVKQLFDLEITFSLKDAPEKTGRVAEFTADADEEDLEVSGVEAGRKREVAAVFWKVLSAFKTELYETHGKPLLIGLEAPPGSSVSDSSSTVASSASIAADLFKNAAPVVSSASASASAPVASAVSTSLSEGLSFNFPVEELFKSLTNAGRFQAWSRSPCTIPEILLPGSPFVAFGGGISGKFLEISVNKRLQMEWKLSGWSAASIVTLEFESTGPGSSLLHLRQEGIPAGELAKLKENWHTFYWAPLRRAFGML